MRVIAKSTLVKFWNQPECIEAKGALQSWHVKAVKAEWKTPQDIKAHYRSWSICGNNLVVFTKLPLSIACLFLLPYFMHNDVQLLVLIEIILILTYFIKKYYA